MWFELHRLLEFVQGFTDIDNDEAVETLLIELERYKSRLQQICKNSPKSAQDRAVLKTEAEIKVDGTSFQVDDLICAETKIISDIFNINELEALQLVLSGEAQLANFSGLNRGLVAVICYYDMHRFLAEVLRIVLSWDKFSMTEKLKAFIENNFAQLSVFKHLLELQGKFNVQSEFTLLSQPEVNGLGGTRHQQVLRSLIEDINESTCEALYSVCEWGCDKNREFAAELYPILKAVPVAEKFSPFHLSVWCSLVKLTSSDVLSQSSSAQHTISDMINEIRNETMWSDQSVCGTIQLVCGISIRAMAVNTVDHMNIANVDIDVDRLVDRAVQNLALKFVRYGILASDSFKNCSAHVKLVDTIFKQVISHFPAKLMEIERNSEDELHWVDQMAEKQQQVTPNGHFSTFLGCITDLYSFADSPKVSNSVKTMIHNLSIGYSSVGSMELCRFMERGRIACHAVHSVGYLEFLRSVCRSKATAAFLFDIFARVPAHHDTMFGWEQVMGALRSYERLFREHKQIAPHFGNQFAAAPQPVIPPQDLAGLISWINLAKCIAELDSEAASMFLEDRSWSLVDAAMGVIAAPVPLVLKGALFHLLASIARKEIAVQRIWASLQSYQICSFAENGALLGLQQELEERECVERRFDTSVGFVHLMSSLLQFSIPDIAAPYLQYLTKSIVSQMASRSYEDAQQMWELAEVSLNALLTILKKSYTDARAVAVREPHVQLLVQILNDTPVYRAICAVLMEDCDVFLSPSPGGSSHRPSLKAAQIAIEILSLACSRYNALKSAIRAANSDFLLATLQVLMLSPLRQTGDNVIDLCFIYLEQADEHPYHSMHAAQIVHDLCLVRPSLQSKMVEQIRFRMRSTGIQSQVKAVRSVLNCQQIQFTIEDLLNKDIQDLDPQWCRGETARLVLEFLADSVQSDPKGQNICYLLFGFNSPSGGQLYSDDSRRTGFHEVIKIVEQFENDLPLKLPFSAVIEPAFRLLQLLVSVDCSYANNVLRYLRSSDLIKRLVSAPALVDCLDRYKSTDDTSTMFSLSRMIAGSVLHLCALEISYLLKNGHYDMPAELYKILLDSREDDDMMEEDCGNLLFNVLQKSHIRVNAEIEFPKLMHFNAQKLLQLFDDCKTKTVFGIIQNDVECLHSLLKREILATQNEDIAYVEREMTAVLEYCTDLNGELLQRGSTCSLVSGCTALLNIVAVFSPVPFLSTVSQLDILTDASFILMEFASSCPSEPLVNICDTILRVCKAICVMSKEIHTEVSLRVLFVLVS
ncbi:unnamed protein product [Auanema sp. JU1783]|nr:unnamed protein product [Auanema sp. JU1783]